MSRGVKVVSCRVVRMFAEPGEDGQADHFAEVRMRIRDQHGLTWSAHFEVRVHRETAEGDDGDDA